MAESNDYLISFADDMANYALELDKSGEHDMCTAVLEIVQLVLIEIHTEVEL